METRFIVVGLTVAAVFADSSSALQTEPSTVPRESRIPAGKASLYARKSDGGSPSSSFTAGPISTMDISCPTWIDWPMPSA